MASSAREHQRRLVPTTSDAISVPVSLATNPQIVKAVREEEIECPLPAFNTDSNSVAEPNRLHRARNHAPSPLDEIPGSLHVHFARFSTKTETSIPDFSPEEITSTRLSLDEEAIVQDTTHRGTQSDPPSRRQKVQNALHNAVSSPSLGVRRIKERLQRTPSSVLSGQVLQQEQQERPSSSDQQAQVCLAVTFRPYIKSNKVTVHYRHVGG